MTTGGPNRPELYSCIVPEKPVKFLFFVYLIKCIVMVSLG